MGRKPIRDEFTNLGVCPEQKYQLRNVRDGKCARCGKRRLHYAMFCDSCAIKRRINQRKGGPHVKGTAGRHPIVEEV